MVDSNSASLKELRRILAGEIVKKHGIHYALGWLAIAYVDGHGLLDTTSSDLIKQIQKLRS